MFQSHSWDSYRWSTPCQCEKWCDVQVSISLLRFLSLIGSNVDSYVIHLTLFQSHSWDSYRWSWNDTQMMYHHVFSFNLTLEILIVDRRFSARLWGDRWFVSISLLRFLSLIDIVHSWMKIYILCFNLTLEILIVDRLAAHTARVDRLQFQSHSWDSYRWSGDYDASRNSSGFVSISLLRFLSLIVGKRGGGWARLQRVSISLLRFLSLIGIGGARSYAVIVVVFQSHSWDSYRWSTRSFSESKK